MHTGEVMTQGITLKSLNQVIYKPAKQTKPGARAQSAKTEPSQVLESNDARALSQVMCILESNDARAQSAKSEPIIYNQPNKPNQHQGSVCTV